MAHEVETMAFANALPWHGLGNRVDGLVTVEEMLVAAGLDWRVEKRPMYARIADLEEGIPQFQLVPNKFALMRDTDNSVLTVTGPAWKPLQNADALGFMRKYAEAGAMTLETAGSLRNGRLVWGLTKLKHDFEVTKGDKMKSYILITSPHEVGRSISVRTTTVRVVCANTLAAASRQSNIEYSQSHVSEFDQALAHEAVERAHEQLAAAERRYKTIAALKLSAQDAITKVFAPALLLPTEAGDFSEYAVSEVQEANVDLTKIILAYSKAPGAINDNGWGAMNAVTYWADHMAGRKAETRLYSSWFGKSEQVKERAEDRLLALAA